MNAISDLPVFTLPRLSVSNHAVSRHLASKLTCEYPGHTSEEIHQAVEECSTRFSPLFQRAAFMSSVRKHLANGA